MNAKALRRQLRLGRRADEPGLVFALMSGGRTVFEDAWGRASLELAAGLDRDSIFNTGSLAKQFVAACLHEQERRGRLSLDDRLRKHLPELPKVYEPVRLRHLLWHTSGVLCYTTLLWWSGWFERAGLPRAQALELLKRQNRLNFKPGSRYLYGNSNYLLLTEVLERVGQGSLGAQAETLLFKPLRMGRTHFREQPARPIPGMVVGHWGEPRAWRVNRHMGATAGPGRLMSNLADMERWARAWTHPPTTLAPILRRMRQPGHLDDGTPIRYGSGLMFQDYRGQPMVRHDGFTAGCRSEICHWPGLEATMICLTNRTDLSPTWLLRRLAGSMWTRAFKAPDPWGGAIPDRQPRRRASAASAAGRAGLYAQEGAARAFDLRPHPQGLAYQSYKTRFVLAPDPFGGYQGLESGSICRLDADGPDRLRLMIKGKPAWYRRLRERPADARRDRAILGSWRCPETGAQTRCSLDHGKVIYHSDAWSGPIRAMDDGSYYLDQVRIEVQGKRMVHMNDDAWILRLAWVKRTGAAHVG